MAVRLGFMEGTTSLTQQFRVLVAVRQWCIVGEQV
jgi:hypothetical protein